MKLRVLKSFKDKHNHAIIYKVGDVINISNGARVANLIKRDLCEPLDDEPVETQAPKVPATPKNEEHSNDAGKPADEPKSTETIESSSTGETATGKAEGPKVDANKEKK